MKMPSKHIMGHGLALVTPFTSADQIDFPSFERILQRALKGNVDFFTVLGPGSESRALTPKESQRLVDFALDLLQGKKPLFLGMASSSTKATLAELNVQFPEGSTRLNPKRGVAGVLIEVPNDPGIPQAGLVKHFKEVAEAAPLPMLLHQRKGPKGSGLTAASVVELSNHPGIMGWVDARCDFALTGEVIRSRAPGFAVVCADDVSALPLLALGADAALSSIGNAFPKAFSDLVGQAQFGELHAARATHHQLAPLLRLLERTASATGIKAVLHQLGTCEPHVRLPLAPMDDAWTQSVYRVIAHMEPGTFAP